MIRLLIADDHPLFREGVRAALGSSSEIEVVGEAADGRQAVQEARHLRPDVVLMDLSMPKLGGLEAIREITASLEDTKTVVLTMLEDDDSLFAAVQAGARGYVLKGADREEIKRTIVAVAQGDVVFGPGVASRVLGSLKAPSGTEKLFPQLTDSERAVLELVVEGLGNREIATRLHLGYKTVRNYVSNVLSKLGAADRMQAAGIAREAGMRPRPGSYGR